MTKDCCPKEHDNSDTLSAETVVADDIIINTGGYISIPDGSNTEPSLRFNTSPTSGLYHTGNTIVVDISSIPVSSISLDTGYITNIIPTQGPTGTASNPAFTFQADTDTGLYRENANQIALTTGGVNRLSISATGMQYSVNSYAPTGMTGAPSYSFSNDPTSGLYFDTTDNSIGVSVSSKKALTINPTGTNFYTNNVLTGSFLSNGFSSPTQDIIFISRTSPLVAVASSSTLATFTLWDTPITLRGFSAPVTGAFVLPETGVYYINVESGWGSNATGSRRTSITPSNTNRMQFTDIRINANTTDATYYNLNGLYNGLAGDSFVVQYSQTSGSSIVFDARLSCVRIF